MVENSCLQGMQRFARDKILQCFAASILYITLNIQILQKARSSGLKSDLFGTSDMQDQHRLNSFTARNTTKFNLKSIWHFLNVPCEDEILQNCLIRLF